MILIFIYNANSPYEYHFSTAWMSDYNTYHKMGAIQLGQNASAALL